MSKFRSHVASATLVWLGTVAPACFGQATPASTPTPTSTPRSEEIAANSRAAASGRLSIDSLATSTSPKAIAKVDGIASPGLKLTLDASKSSGGRVWYRWIQTQGPRVVIQGADRAEASLIVPDEATTLGFVLVVGNSGGVDARSLVVEVENPDNDGAEQPLKADAGADRAASVGRRVVLDGLRSEPKGRVRYRWVQTAGPKATIASTAGSTCSFVAEAEGTYQFALLVIGSSNIVSEPSVVAVQVSATTSGPEQITPDRPPIALDELARSSLAAIPGGSRYVGELSRAFDAVADRIDSFKTYFDAASDLTGRLDAVVPRNPDFRGEWIDQFFKPWTAKVAERMRPEGVDLTQPNGQLKPLSKSQRTRLADQFRLTAAGLRAGNRVR